MPDLFSAAPDLSKPLAERFPPGSPVYAALHRGNPLKFPLPDADGVGKEEA